MTAGLTQALAGLLGGGKRRVALTAFGAVLALAGAGAGAAKAAELQHQIVSVDGEDRPYALYVPANLSRSAFHFVVFALPDNGQTAEQFADQSGWPALAERDGFAVVFPEPGRGGWAPNSGGDDPYLKAVFDHARTHLTLPPGAALQGPPAPRRGEPEGGGGRGGAAAGGEQNARGRGGPQNRVPTWLPWYYLTGAGEGARAGQEFAIDYPGLFAAVATLNGGPFDAAYLKGQEPAQNYFEYMRGGKNAIPVWKQLKKDVPEAVWLFSAGAPSPAETKAADYWKRSAAVAAASETRSIGGLQTTVFANPANHSQEVRLTTLPAGARYDAALSAAIWDGFFSHVARWTSSANGDLGPMLTQAEVNKSFDVKTVDVGDGKPYTYYVKTPSTYRKGQHLPVIISAHGANYPAWLYLSQIRFHELGEKEGFITVYPNAHNQMWDFTDPNGSDQKFYQQLVADLVKDYGVDKSRVYLQGFSFGSGMTYMMGISYPQLFAAVSPNNGIGPMSKAVQDRVKALKAKGDVRIPMMIVYGDVDAGGSVDAKIPAQGILRDAIDEMKAYNHITTPDQYRPANTINSKPHDELVPGGELKRTATDARFPDGRFRVYQYASADPKPLNLFDFAWVTDLPHGADLREADLEWDYLKHWRRGPTGALTYVP